MVAEQYPWPASDGYRQRLHHLVAGLAGAGEVDVFALRRPGTAEPGEPPLGGVRGVSVEAGGDAGFRQWGPRWLRGDMPRRVLAPDWSAMRRRLVETGESAERYDLVWFSHVDSWWAVHDVLPGIPTVVDFDNLEHLALKLRRRIPPRVPPDAGWADRMRTLVRWATSRLFDLVDERRWDRMQRRCGDAVARVVVCSDLDVARSGCPNAVVVPNGCDRPSDVDADRTRLRGDGPTMLFVGALDYEPNTEAVEWFVREVLPLVRADLPEARMRIVGRGAERVSWVATESGVDLVGPVDDVRPELEVADVAIVPIRVGAGTRLKVVEALANRLPLVTTTVGCEGIAVTHDVDALVADDPKSFARACIRLGRDGAERQRLGDAGFDLFAARYDWADIEARVADLAHAVVDDAGTV